MQQSPQAFCGGAAPHSAPGHVVVNVGGTRNMMQDGEFCPSVEGDTMLRMRQRGMGMGMDMGMDMGMGHGMDMAAYDTQVHPVVGRHGDIRAQVAARVAQRRALSHRHFVEHQAVLQEANYSYGGEQLINTILREQEETIAQLQMERAQRNSQVRGEILKRTQTQARPPKHRGPVDSAGNGDNIGVTLPGQLPPYDDCAL